MSTAEHYSESPVGLNWTPRCLQTAGDLGVNAQLADRLRFCSEKLRPVDDAESKRIRKVADHLVRSSVMVTFGGRFKSGKSTLVNLLLGRELLPVNVEAETGAPCSIRAGDTDRASVYRHGHLVGIPCNTEAIREQLSLWRHSLSQTEAELAARVELELSGVSIPPRARWVDTPGLDDSIEMDIASLEVFGRTDVLMWVLSSDAALSVQEMDYIRDHVQEAGPRGIVFVTNVFSRPSQSYHESWVTFVDRQLPALCSRINDSTETMGFDGYPPRMLAVCAAAIGQKSLGGYGARAVHELVCSISAPEHSLATACRLERVSRVANRATAALAGRLQQIKISNDAVEKQSAEWERSGGSARALFERRVSAALETMVADYSSSTNNAGRTVAMALQPGKLLRDGSYGRFLHAQVMEALRRTTSAFTSAVLAAASEAGQVSSFADLLTVVNQEINVPVPVLQVPNTPKKTGGAVALIVIGVLTALWTGGLGLIPLCIGIFMLIKAGEGAQKADLAGTQRLIVQQANQFAQQSSEWKTRVHNVVLKMFRPAGTPPPKANRTNEAYLEELVRELKLIAVDAQRLASDMV